MSLETNSFVITHIDISNQNRKLVIISGVLDISNPNEVKNFIKSIKDQHEVVMERVKKVDPEIKTETE
jgi:hypothetical protein